MMLFPIMGCWMKGFICFKNHSLRQNYSKDKLLPQYQIMRKFYLVYRDKIEISQTLSAKLGKE